MQITITNGRGKAYVAKINGLHPKFKFDRQFLTLYSAGNKMNCYEDFRTAEDVGVGEVVEIKTYNYKGVEKRYFAQVMADASLKEIPAADVFAIVAEKAAA